MSAPENPPAFPEVPGDFNAYEGRAGMTLRDWFAGQALASVIAALQREPAFDLERSLRLAARGAYIVADAMLAERGEA